MQQHCVERMQFILLHRLLFINLKVVKLDQLLLSVKVKCGYKTNCLSCFRAIGTPYKTSYN